MFLWLVKQDVNCSQCVYNAAVVCAGDEYEAKAVILSVNSRAWAYYVELEVQLIGKANDDIEPGIILALS